MLPLFSGTGIVYCLTVRDVEQVATWLQLHGHDVLPYTGGTDGDDRLGAEAKLQRNEVKALVATSALGMGYDKPDLAFVVHSRRRVRQSPTTNRSDEPEGSSTSPSGCSCEEPRTRHSGLVHQHRVPDAQEVDAVLSVFAFAAGRSRSVRCWSR
jgi:hypothetical protein